MDKHRIVADFKRKSGMWIDVDHFQIVWNSDNGLGTLVKTAQHAAIAPSEWSARTFSLWIGHKDIVERVPSLHGDSLSRRTVVADRSKALQWVSYRYDEGIYLTNKIGNPKWEG
eukprot:scaffold405_cov179-Ochromonas_danica.AAC.6